MARSVTNRANDIDAFDVGDADADGGHLKLSRDVRRVQISQTVRSIPLLVLFHASAGLCLRQLIAPAFSANELLLFQIVAVLVGVGFGIVFFAWRSERWQNRPEMVLQTLSLLSLALALVWAQATDLEATAARHRVTRFEINYN